MHNSRISRLSPFLYSGFILFFFILGIFRLYRHEMWLDETGPWLLARDSANYFELVFNKRYEGHPNLWYTLLFVLTRFSQEVVVMQWFHLLLITGFLALFLFKSPFSPVFKLLFGFSYYIFYEYQTLSRLYAVELLLLGVLCYRYNQKKGFLLVDGLLLFLLAQTNLFGLIFTLFFSLLKLYERHRDNRLGKDRQNLWAGLLPLVGIGYAIYSMIPPADCGFAAGWHLSLDGLQLQHTLATIWNGFVPFPILFVEFWNNNIVTSESTRAVLGLLIYGITIAFFLKKPKFLLFYLSLSGSALLFFYIKYPGFTRHHGHLFIYFLATLWLCGFSARLPFPFRVGNPFGKALAVYLLLFAQVGAGIFAAAVDWVYPFAPNKQAADFIRSLPQQYPIVAQHHLHCSPIAAYLNQKLFYPNSQKFGSFYQLSWRDLQIPTLAQSLQASQQLTRQLKKPVLLVTLDKIEQPEKHRHLKALYQTDWGIFGNLTYYIYEISH